MKFNFLNLFRSKAKLDNLTHVYDYSNDQLLQHYAREIISIDNCLRIVLIGEEETNRHLVEVIKDAGKPSDHRFYQFIPSYDNAIPNRLQEPIDVFVITTDEPKIISDWVSKLVRSTKYKNIPILYKVSVAKYHHSLIKYDLLPSNIKFIDDEIDYRSFNKIYLESLKNFKIKCQVKDALDLFQTIAKTKDIEGDQIEVGSYKGHSGWLIKKFSQHYHIDKLLYLCDVFGEFPNENLGIDKSWSGSHKVNFDTVEKKFQRIHNVRLVRGDIRRTIPKLFLDKLSFIFLDIDSYDATKFALKILFPKLNTGGVVLCEDYGESHCVGARLAINEFFSTQNVFSFTSFYSGCKLFRKL